MKKILLILISIMFNITIFAQNFTADSLINFINYAIKGYTPQIVNDNERTLLPQFDSISQYNSLEYLYDYSNNELLYSKISNVYHILNIFAYSKYENIKQKAINLILDIYRISKSGGYFHRFYKYSDFDDKAKEKILKIINNEPYNVKELFVLHYRIEKDYKKIYHNDTLFIRRYLKTTKLSIDELRDSLIKAETEECMNELDCKSSYKLELYKIGAGLYMYELIPNLEKLLVEDTLNKRVYKLCLARLGNIKYQKEIINEVYKTGIINCSELGFLNTADIYKAIIFGLRVDGMFTQVGTGLNRLTGKYETHEFEMGTNKFHNFENVVYSNIFTSVIPNSFLERQLKMIMETDQLEDLELCEELAKWLEDNKNKLYVSPKFRY
ncbi:MAG: hypothetical protein MJ211_12205 [Bacteroidales bacterium]|nr:hypothetical protein [Bacteroidales bacterium]